MKKIVRLIKKKWSEYVIEILVIIIGIFGAFLLNDWNEKRKQENFFLIIIDQLYNSVYTDISNFENHEFSIDRQIELINEFTNKKKEISKQSISELFYLDTYGTTSHSESKILSQKLEFNFNNELQNTLSKKIFGSYLYINFFNNGFNFNNDERFTKFLISEKLPKPAVFFGYHGTNTAIHDISVFNDNHLEIVKKLLVKDDFHQKLKSLRSIKYLYKQLMSNGRTNAEDLLKSLSNYNPNIKLQFEDIQIIGSALKYGFNKGVSMIKMNKRNSFWKIKLNLTDGKIKFRNGNNWAQNWGGNSFPKGKANWYGNDIYVKKGYYEIILDLDEKYYSFKKLNSNNLHM